MKLDWIPGNRFRLLENGEEFFPRVFQVIAQARKEVLLETFIWFVDPVGLKLREALIAAARRGAEVHVLFDGWGSPGLDVDFLRPMQQAGVRLRSFEPLQRLFGARLNMLRRMHRKLLVVDGECAFVGGINYSADHMIQSGPEGKQDYAVEIEGPLVKEIRAFCRASLAGPQPRRERWQRAYRRAWPTRVLRRRARRREPAADSQPGALAAFVTRDNRFHRDDIERQYRIAIRAARSRIIIANAYFFPGWRLLRDLRRAARRGVQVDLVLQGEPDLRIVRTAARLLHGYLVSAGVRIHEYCERPLHGKVAAIDDRWATVGSSNLDPISLGLNLEANVLVDDPGFASALRRRLDVLIDERCQQVKLPQPRRLQALWIAVRSAVIFHFLRRFPAWASHLPAQRPRVTTLPAETG